MLSKSGDQRQVSRWFAIAALVVGGSASTLGQTVVQEAPLLQPTSAAEQIQPIGAAENAASTGPAAQQNPATQPPAEELPTPPRGIPLEDPIRIPDTDAENPGAAAESGMIEDDGATELVPPPALTVADVIASVYGSFPEIIRAREQARLANGLLLEAYGAYDTKLKAETLNEPTGFYENYRHAIGLARQNWWGGNVSAGYRVGRGEFQPWYLERETETGGEFKLGYVQPLLQGFAIDPQRVAVFQASLERQAADPVLQQAILETARDAIMAYWAWVASGATLSAQQDLLRFAEIRGRQFEELLKAGAAAEIDVVLNQQLIAERRGNVIKAEQKFRANALKLSVFLRDEQGQPLLPDDEWLLPYFPVIDTLPDIDLQQEIVSALQRRPEPRRLQIELRQLDLDRQLARNQFLPRLDFIIEGSQDMGGAATSSDDKGEFVLVVGAASEVPIPRRKARGKIQSTSAKIVQKGQKLRLQRDKISVELQTALSNLVLASEIVEQALLAFEAAIDTRDRYEVAFARGLIDLISLNLLEIKAAESEVKLIEARQSWFAELAAYQAAAGLDPMEQANVLIQLPLDDSDPSSNGEAQLDVNQLEQDIRRRAGGVRQRPGQQPPEQEQPPQP